MSLSFWKNEVSNSNSNESNKGTIKNQILVAIVMNFAQVAQGSSLAWMSPMSVFLQRPDSPSGYPMSANVVFWAVSCISIGAMIAMPIIGFISQRYGRKPAAICTCIPMAISWILVGLNLNQYTLIISRILAGMSTSASYLTCVLYIGETADPHCRGALGSTIMFMNSIGVLLGYLTGGYLHYKVAAIILLIISLIHIAAFIVLPETPVYLVKLGRIEDAKCCLGYFKSLPHNHKIIEDEIEKLLKQKEAENSAHKPTCIEILKDPINRRPFVVTIVLSFLVALNGGFAISNYVSTIFDAALKTTSGGSGLSLTLSSSLIGVLMVMGCATSIFTIDKFGRKALILSCSIMCFLSMGGLGAWFFLSEKQLISVPWLPLMFLGIFVIANIAGPTTALPVIIGEMFKFEVRSALSSMIYMFIWLLSFITLFVFNPLTQLIGVYGLMWIFAIFNFLLFFFTITFVPETKQKTFDQISAELFGKSKPKDIES